MNEQTRFSIEELTPDHLDWREFVALVNDLNQEGWVFNPYFEQFSRYFLAAKQNGAIVGFLMFVVWDIGPHDRDHPPIQMDGKTLREAKILAFGVKEGYRRQGIGTALQEYTIQQAKLFGCYQVRSVSGENHSENHQLKLAMGFAVEPMERDEKCLAFVMPLKSSREK
ncbi:MAG: GNAT family N-acetyltransferase [Candidatus Poribacteria bacterium]|nr:GNAT family N-acetyltransferase [Candidatus Poribacteria bacterium]